MEEEFNELYETIIGDGVVKKEPCDTDDEPRSIHNYIGIKNEFVEGSTAVVLRETGYTIDNCTDVEVCINETEIRRGFVQKELCDMEKEQESIRNYHGIKNEIVEDSTAVVTQETEFMTDCIDDKVDVYETVISHGYIKQEPCDVENNLGVVEETKIIEDLSVAIQESRRISNINGNNLTCCKGCGEEYDLYCLKCHLTTHEDVKSFQTKETPNNHVRNVHDEKQKKFKCSKCDFKTVYSKNLKEHLLYVHSGIKRFKCPRCPFKTCRRKSLNCHLRRHEKARPIKCESCDIKFGDVQLFAHHRKEVHAIGDKTYSFACRLCSYKATTNSKLRQHVVVHNDAKPFACSLCPYKTKTNLSLKRHVIAIHNDDKPFECKQCPYKTKTKSQLKIHFATHSEDKPFVCSLCPYKTKINSQLKRHVVIHNDDKPYGCPQCPYKAKTYSHLKRHIVIHTEDKPFACIHCSYKSKTDQQLRQHIVVHSDDKPFGCAQCPFKTKSSWQLRQHITIHKDDKPFACIHCPFKTKTKAQLRQHIAIHNDDKFFACSFCPYKTTINRQLKAHLAIHKDDKPFACTHCPYKAKTKARLKQHIAIHNEDISFACSHCSYKTKTKSYLKQHVATHSDDKPFACSLCSYETKTNLSLKRHITLTHKDDNPLSSAPLRPNDNVKVETDATHIAVDNVDKSETCV